MPTNINQLADEYLRLSYHGLRAKNKSFNSNFKAILDENLPEIEVVAQDIGRVLLNLCNNSFYAVWQKSKKMIEHPDLDNKYNPEVTITTKALENEIIVSINDNGIGMSDAIKQKIFQPFFTTKPSGEGTGLGLSLAYDIITKGHGGSIEAESVEGEGTEIKLHFPLV